MTGTSNPIDSVLVDNQNVSKSDFRAFVMGKLRQTVANADAINEGDWSMQTGGLHLASNGADYDMDTSDTTTEDDGDNLIRDANGIAFVKQAPIIEPVQKLITATDDVTIDDDETADEIEIDNTSGAAINVFLPDVTVRTKPITVTDVGGNGATHNITIQPADVSPSQTIMTGTQYVIDSNGGGIRLTPNSSKTGWK